MFQKDEINLTLIIIVCSITFLVFIISFLILFRGYYLRRLKFYKEKQNLEFNFKQQLLQTQLEIQEQTLKTISQEIHDNVGQVLSLVKLNLSSFTNTESGSNQPKINDTKQLVSKAINDLRDLSRSLYGNKIAELGLTDAIGNELKILQNSGQFKTSLKISGEPFKLSPQKEIVVYRMMQESINNAIKHAKAQNIDVVLKYNAGLFSLTIADDGIGFDTTGLQQPEPGMGLKSMKSRAALIGAEFSVESFQQKGTTVSITLQHVIE